MKLFTVGYEKSEIDDFCKRLKTLGVKCVADIRKNPISRKKGFSKKKLAENLRKKKIDYIHLPGLGVPTYWRKEAKAKIITRERMFKDYKEKILPKHAEELKILRSLLSTKGLALLCYEIDASDCHRYFVAKKLKQLEKGKLLIKDINLFE